MDADECLLTLAIDVGNSRIKFGLFESTPGRAADLTLPESTGSFGLPAGENIDWDDVAAALDRSADRISAAVVAGPNPVVVQMILSNWPDRMWPQPRVICQPAELPLRTSVDSPDKVGIYRLLNAVAANLLRPNDRAAIVVSAGTATTVDLISPDGTFAGGAILPGLELGARALHQYTALLPLIDIPELSRQEVAILGRNTAAAICSGLWHGQVGAIRELVARLTETVPQPTLILVTGGNGRLLASALGPDFRFETDLALRGLAFVARTVVDRIHARGTGDLK